MQLSIDHWIRLTSDRMVKDGNPLLGISESVSDLSPEDTYRQSGFNYPKFFKMDLLCKWAWLGAESLLNKEDQYAYEGMDKQKVAVVLMTGNGCLDIDKKYQQSVQSIPSPALFVYTLSNIMLGEICIRHGFKGEQTCMVSSEPDGAELYFWVKDLLENRGMEACLCGWVDAVNYQHDVSMFWVTRTGNGLTFSPAAMQQIMNS